jgi:hypothetical protein
MNNLKLLLLIIAVFAVLFMSKYGYPANFDKTTVVNSKAANTSLYSIINSFNIYYSINSMNYSEYNSQTVNHNTDWMDSEHASGLTGIGVSLEGVIYREFPIWQQISYSKVAGTSNYTCSEFNHCAQYNNNDTDHLSFTRASYRIGYAFYPASNIAIIPNIGYEYINWNRNLIYNNGITGYIEHYYFNQELFGVKAYYIPISKLWISGEAYYTYGHNNSMNTNISGTDMSFTLGNRGGYLLGLKTGYEAYNNNNLILSPYVGVGFQHIGVNRSSLNSYGYFEPKDNSNQILLNFGVKVSF